MAEIIDFRKLQENKKDSKIAEKKPSTQFDSEIKEKGSFSSMRISEHEIEETISVMGFLTGEGGERIKKIQDNIKRGDISSENFQKNKVIAQTYSIEELIGWINNSSESDWMKKPAFFRAITDVFLDKARVLKNKS